MHTASQAKGNSKIKPALRDPAPKAFRAHGRDSVEPTNEGNASACRDEWQRDRRGQKTRHQPADIASKDQRNECGESAGRNHARERKQRLITSRSAALVAEGGARKTIPASNGSKSKHEHASRRTPLFS